LNHNDFLDQAVVEAKSTPQGSIKSGAVLVKAGEVIASSGNQDRILDDPIATAEMNCIRQAGRRNDQSEWILYVTSYPDMLTVGTIIQFSIGSLVVGRPRIKSSEIELLAVKGVRLEFVDHDGCSELATAETLHE